MSLMIIKTKKMSAKEVKHKFHEFVDELADDCGPELEEMAEGLKQHGDEFIDALSGNGHEASYRRGRSRSHYRGDGGGSGHRSGNADYRHDGADYRNEGDWHEREELRQQNERKMQELERELRELKMRQRGDW